MTGPLGADRGDVQAGMIAQTVANVNRPKGKAAYKLTDFIPKWDRTPRRRKVKQSLEEMVAVMRRATVMLGGRIEGQASSDHDR